MFTQDLFKPSIRLEEDDATPMPGTPPSEDRSTPASGTPLGKGGATPALKANPRTSVGPVGQDQEPEMEMVAIIGPPSPDVDWRRPIYEYLQLGTILDDETETQRLARRAKGYLIHNGKLYRCSASGILQ
jgi:hypothetical protein